MSEFKLLYITCSSSTEAKNLAKKALEEGMIACANILNNVQSIYKWENEIQENTESILLLKTHESKLEELKELILRVHSYDCPCILTLEITDVNRCFGSYIKESILNSVGQ